MPRERTHWEGCWRERTHHDCALVRIAALEAELAAERERLEAKKLEVDAAMDCYKAALNAMRKDWREMFESTQAAGVELAAERERRKAAEALLHNYARLANAAMFDANRSGYEYDRKGEMVDISAHFARYKD